jgi:hypothetical protein
MPTAVRKRGNKFVAIDKNTGKVLTKPTSKKNAISFGRFRDSHRKRK